MDLNNENSSIPGRAMYTVVQCERTLNGMKSILPVPVPVKNIKGAARQCYGDGDGIVCCEQTFTVIMHGTFCQLFNMPVSVITMHAHQ